MKRHLLSALLFGFAISHVQANQIAETTGNEATLEKTLEQEKQDRVTKLKEWVEEMERENEVLSGSIKHQAELAKEYQRRLKTAKIEKSKDLNAIELAKARSRQMYEGQVIRNNNKLIANAKKELAALEQG